MIKRASSFFFLFFLLPPVFAYDALIAVASNFKPTLALLIPQFERKTGFTVEMVSASSGKLFAQITHGAPYDAFLSADDILPALLVKNKQAIKGTVFTYATGKLVLWSENTTKTLDKNALLNARNIAMANPKHAPYGRAAMQVMEKLKVKKKLAGHLVIAENIAQAFQFVQTGNAEMGFIALAFVDNEAQKKSKNLWIIPGNWYSPIKQDAVLVRDNKAAKAFLQFLQSDSVRQQIRQLGYD